MRAVVQDRYGPPHRLRVADVDRPRVAAHEVLVRVHAASVHPDVWHVVTGRPYVLRLMGSGLRRPAPPIPGTDMAGVVVEVGRDVRGFQPGDEVFGETLRGFSWRHGGAFAEYVSAPQDGLQLKPAGVPFAEAATVPTIGYITLFNLPLHRLVPGAAVLVNGAGGGVGLFAVQIAKARGAQVTGVELSGRLDLVRSAGADRVIDGGREDYTSGDQRYDVIVDIPGNRPFAACRRVLAAGGQYVLIGHEGYGRDGRRFLGLLPRFGGLVARSAVEPRLRRGGGRPPTKPEAMATLRELLESGALRPVVDRTFRLEEAGQAIDYLAARHNQGRVVLVM